MSFFACLLDSQELLQYFLDIMLDGLIGKKCVVYLDDVIIYSKTFEETLANLKLVMARLREQNLLAKA